ncbi:Uncharacterised protein [Enterobacter cloacae]|nr:Uncharacterised protein [Enterobacter cloacae]
MGENAALQPVIQAFTFFVITITCRDFAIGAFVVRVNIAGIAHALCAVSLLYVPAQGTVLERYPVQADVMRRPVIPAGVHAIVSPCLRQKFIQRNADVERQKLVVVSVFLAVAGF